MDFKKKTNERFFVSNNVLDRGEGDLKVKFYKKMKKDDLEENSEGDKL